MLTDEQRLIIRAVDSYIDAANVFTDVHDRIRHEIRTPFHPAYEIAEIYTFQMRPLFEALADDYQLDVKIKTRFRLQRPKSNSDRFRAVSVAAAHPRPPPSCFSKSFCALRAQANARSPHHTARPTMFRAGTYPCLPSLLSTELSRLSPITK
jgi:hypothetical protein